MTNISQELVARISLSFAAAKATFPLMIVDVDVRMVVGKLFILLFGGIFFCSLIINRGNQFLFCFAFAASPAFCSSSVFLPFLGSGTGSGGGGGGSSGTSLLVL